MGASANLFREFEDSLVLTGYSRIMAKEIAEKLQETTNQKGEEK
jgi:hypothetical protein